MEPARIILCSAPEDAAVSLDLARRLAADGYECRPAEPSPRSRGPEDFGWADVMVLLLTQDANTSDDVLREVEEAVGAGLRIVPVHLDGSPPSGALRYYLGPFQWVERDRSGDFMEGLLQALSPEGTGGERTGTRRVRRRIPVAAGVVAVAAAAVLLVARPLGAGDGAAAPPAGADFLMVSTSPDTATRDFLRSLGYTVACVPELPEPGELARHDALVLGLQGDPSLAVPLYEYVCGGGSLLLSSCQPWFMQMPPWIGMETYSNFWGADFPVTAPSAPPPGMPGLEGGAVLIYYTAFVDGAAVLKDPTTAVVDACFDGIDSLAAAVRNTVGEGRVAWLSAYDHPQADPRGNEYTTDAYTEYLEALYAWLDRDGPRGTP